MNRSINLLELLSKKSFFLLGPRGTGKTFLIREQIADKALIIDLLKSSVALPLRNNPSELAPMIAASDRTTIVIDEVQKLPELLDEVHSLIEEKNYRFLLTGSSARKLKRGHANMLGGRASLVSLHPLTWRELTLAKRFDLSRLLRIGGLPRAYLGENGEDELFDYVETYLQEEIQAESLVRSLPNFSRFLKIVALTNGQLTNYANVASDVGLSATTIKEYYQILDDTLLGYSLPCWQESKKRKAIATAKHFLFDIGVCHTLAGTKSLDRNSSSYGISFEHFLINEVRAFLRYQRLRDEMCFWRTKHHDEVDLVIGDHTAIEIKAAEKVSERDTKSLVRILEEKSWKNLLLVSNDPIVRKFGDQITLLPWQLFLEKLWARDFF